jgi:hypothetical protein
MAIYRDTRYPGRWAARNTNYPQGSFKNKSSPTASDGSYAEQDWLNDWDGFFGRLITVAGITPNGNVDNATSSQYFDALLKVLSGRMSSTKIVTSTPGSYTYTPSSTLVKFITVEVVGAGGSGSGCSATSNQGSFSGGGGGAGGTAKKTMSVVYNQSYPYIVGQGGKSVSGAIAGIGGGNSVFNNQVYGAGGNGAGTGGNTYMLGGSGGSATGGDVNISGGDGGDGQNGQLFSTGNGGSSSLGGGGRAGAGGGNSGKAIGSGGGGAYDSTFSGNSYASGKGADGMIVITEYY